jgi:putative Mg2+ transporter-C (MgtC) family protein
MTEAHALSAADALERLGIALALGFLIGFEREWRQGMAGLHTFTLVAIGAVLFTLLPMLAGQAGEPMRIAAQIVTGIGFLAGAVIIREGASIRGLVTAATLWATAAIGSLVGNGFFVEACVGTLVVVGLNYLLPPLSERLAHGAAMRAGRKALRVQFTSMKFKVDCVADAVARVHGVVVGKCNGSALTLHSFETKSDQAGSAAIAFELHYPGSDRRAVEALTRAISNGDGVTSLRWETTEHLL